MSTLAFSFVRPILGSQQYGVNAVWIQNAGWIAMNKNILITNLTKVVDDLGRGNITFAFVFAGYWDASSSTIGYAEPDSVWTTVIDALHAIDVKVLAWVENDGTMNISSTNWPILFSQINNCMSKGFDGYNDDIEDWNGSLQNWIDWENNCTLYVHSLGKIMTADVGYDWQQDVNPYLYMDYIVSMFYSSKSTLESPQAAAYWQEDFGEYSGHNTPPASPMIIGLMNYYGNSYPLAWQLNQVDNYLAAYGHPQLVGFCIWLYEYMGTNPDDWAQWNYWITSLGTAAPPLYTVTIDSTPMTGIQIEYNGVQRYTPDVEYAFTGTMIVNAPSSVDSYYFSQWQDGYTSPTEVIDVNTNITLVAVYVETPPSLHYGSIGVFGTSFGVNVTFQAWIDNSTPVQVPSTGYTFTNVTVGSHTVHASFNDTTYDADANVVEGSTTTVPFNFGQSAIAELPNCDLLLIVIYLSAIFAIAYYSNGWKKLVTPRKTVKNCVTYRFW